MTIVLATPPYQQFYDANGDPLNGGLVYTYSAGTDTPKATYTDQAGGTQMTNPIVLDSAGRSVWFIDGSYKYVVKDSLGNTIRTVDNVTSFQTLAASADAFFQTFSGDGTTTAFTLSTALGTEEKALLVFLDKKLEPHVSNGAFATDTVWTKGAGWTIAAGVATATGAISTAISQTSLVTLVQGQAYNITFTMTRSAGSLIASIGGGSTVEQSTTGTYRNTLIAGSTQTLAFTGNAFTGTLDDVSITVATDAGYDIQAPTLFTVSGTTLTFATAPPAGTNNIYVFAPSTLVGAASASAAAAATSEANAAASAVSAAARASVADADARTFGLTDADKYVYYTGAGGHTWTIPTNASVAFDTDDEIDVVNNGTGNLTLTADTGVTVNGQTAKSITLPPYTNGNLKKIATNTWVWLGHYSDGWA